MKILILTSVLSRKAGGLFYSVPNLTKAIVKNGCNAYLSGFFDEFYKTDSINYDGLKICPYSVFGPLKNYSMSKDLRKCIRKIQPQVIHQQGIWSFLSFFTLRYKRTHKECKTIITPRGMLDPWILKRSPLKKFLARKIFEDNNLHNADCLHALCYSEYKSMREYGLKNPIAIIPNGITIPTWKRNYDLYKSKKIKSLLFLSRLHPKKGIFELICAFANIKEKNPELVEQWKLIIGGWGSKEYIQTLENEIENKGLSDNVKMLGPVYGNDKDLLLKECDVFILPSYSEGLPMAILEAWAYGLPVITTEFSNLPEGFETGAAYKIENNIDKLTDGLLDFMMKSNKDIIEYGRNGYKLVSEKFSWDIIGKKTIDLYNWVLEGGPKPDFILEY